VISEDDAPGADGEVVWAKVEPGGVLHSCVEPSASPDGWGRGQIKAWIPAILEGRSNSLLVGDDEKLVSDCLAELYNVLWQPGAFD
jgi:hypothetical protein